MVCETRSAALLGIDAKFVSVEVHIGKGLPSFEIVGLPENSVKEGRRRIHSALEHSGLKMPERRVTVNLAPADWKKQGARFDLAIAIAILGASGAIPIERISGKLFLGELGLDGSIKPCTGLVAAAEICKQAKLDWIITAEMLTALAAFVMPTKIIGFSDLASLVQSLKREDELKGAEPTPWPEMISDNGWQELLNVEGMWAAKNALAVAAAGFHSLLMVGPPGAGKSMLAKCLRTLLPPLSKREQIEKLKVMTVKEPSPALEKICQRPFRCPHHTVSVAGFLGRAQGRLPGELALAHRGVLFLDEFPEFRRDILESMREPLEEGQYHLSRSWGEVSYPAQVLLVAAMNPCPCGYDGTSGQVCQCSAGQIQRYRKKISGPILDRLDITLFVERQSIKVLAEKRLGGADDVKMLWDRILASAYAQKRRYRSEAFRFNSELPANAIDDFLCAVSRDLNEFYALADSLNMTFRSTHRCLRVARTVADMDGSETVQTKHFLQALQYQSSPFRADA